MAVSFFTDSIIVQTTVFVIASTLLIFVTRPFVEKFAKTKKPVPTNVYSLIGKEGRVTEEIDLINGTGQVKVSGETWSATCKGNATIAKGTMIKILEVNGVKLLVEPIKEEVTSVH